VLLTRKSSASKAKASRSGRWLSEDWGPCLARSRHPTAQVGKSAYWRPHLKALQIGATVSSLQRVLADCDRVRGPRPYSIAELRREAASVTSLFSIGMRPVNVKGCGNLGAASSGSCSKRKTTLASVPGYRRGACRRGDHCTPTSCCVDTYEAWNLTALHVFYTTRRSSKRSVSTGRLAQPTLPVAFAGC